MAVVDINWTSFCEANFSSQDCDLISKFEAGLVPVLVILLIVGLIADGIIFYVIIVERNTRTVPDILMANLSLAYFFYLSVIGISDVTGCILTQTYGSIHPSVLPASVTLFVSMVTAVNVGVTCTALMIHNYLEMIDEARRCVLFQSVKVAVSFSLLVWIISTLMCVPVFIGKHSYPADVRAAPSHGIPIILSFVISYIIPLIVVTIIYLCIGCKLRKSTRTEKPRNETTPSSTNTTTADIGNRCRQLRALRAIWLMIIFFAVSFGFFYIDIITLSTLRVNVLTLEIVSHLSQTVTAIAASLSPVVLCRTHPHFVPHANRAVHHFRLCCESACGSACGHKSCRNCSKDGEDDVSFSKQISSVSRMFIRKLSTIGGTVNATDEFVLVDASEDKQAQQEAQKTLTLPQVTQSEV